MITNPTNQSCRGYDLIRKDIQLSARSRRPDARIKGQNNYFSGLAEGLRGISCKCRRNIANIELKDGLLDALNWRQSPIIFHKSLGIPTPTTLAYCGGNLPPLTTARYISSALRPAHLHSKCRFLQLRKHLKWSLYRER